MRVIDRTADAVQTQQVEIEGRSSDLVRANRTLRVLSGINSLIVRAHDREELFREACRMVVEEGGFPMAWIGIADRSAMKLVPVAFAGRHEALLTAIKYRLAEGPDPLLGNTVTALAMRTKQAVVCNDLQNDARVVFAKQYAESGIRSMVNVPLIVADEAMGVLAMYAEEVDFFNTEELKHLTELAGDIAFAIDHINKQERLDYLAYHDVLTGAANRALLHERLEQSLVNATAHGRKLALVLLDIERFKTINDTLGRLAGDALLKDVAARMSQFAADAGQLARMDADHFAFMVPEVKAEEAVAHLIEQRMQKVFGPPFLAGDTELRVSARFGIAVFPADGGDADTLLKNAEAALKNAKAGGDRYLFYTQTMNARVAGKLSLENRLRQAIDRKEFVLHYQPKVNLASGKLTGAEALIRWSDPRTGLVPPGEFIPILEETGLIYDVGRWALRKAVADYLRWLDAGLPAVRIAVNVSPLQLRNRGFVAEIARVIGASEHAAAGLELEITESLIMEDVMHNIASLRAIRAMGVRVSIDDFGTGFSSLSHLSKLPVDTLKIDRSFVVDMTVGPEGLALVSTIIKLAHSLKLKVVAQGVETEEQSRLLRLLSCDEMQGYLFSTPVPGKIFETSFLQSQTLEATT
jgi:diguanylate cyclase (GGDEF)-like protein